jgi:orotate phosphoribosyltransferase-like protein
MSKKDQVIKLHEKGMSPKDISEELHMLNSNVYKIISDYKKDKRLEELELKVK